MELESELTLAECLPTASPFSLAHVPLWGVSVPVLLPGGSTYRATTLDLPLLPLLTHTDTQATRHPCLPAHATSHAAPARRVHEWAGKVGPTGKVFAP